MSSLPPALLWPVLEPAPLRLPLASARLAAGFPSPAEDHVQRRLDLNELMITHPLATFFWRVRGHSMVEAGIGDGDLLVVNRALAPGHRSIVVAQLDGDFTVKYLWREGACVRLVAANPAFPEIRLRDGQELVVCGVVTHAIKRF